jgi:hypothetical protein
MSGRKSSPTRTWLLSRHIYGRPRHKIASPRRRARYDMPRVQVPLTSRREEGGFWDLPIMPLISNSSGRTNGICQQLEAKNKEQVMQGADVISLDCSSQDFDMLLFKQGFNCFRTLVFSCHVLVSFLFKHEIGTRVGRVASWEPQGWMCCVSWTWNRN